MGGFNLFVPENKQIESTNLFRVSRQHKLIYLFILMHKNFYFDYISQGFSCLCVFVSAGLQWV